MGHSTAAVVATRRRGARLVAILPVALAACGGRPPPPQTLVVDSAGVRIAQDAALPDEPPVLVVDGAALRSFGGSDAPVGEELVYLRGHAARMDDGFVVADTRSGLVLLGFDGSTRMVARRGEGPGEVLYPSIVGSLPADSLLVYDARLRRVSIFDIRGAFARSYGAPPAITRFSNAAGLLPGGHIAFSGGQWTERGWCSRAMETCWARRPCPRACSCT